MTYIPKPIDTSAIALSPDIEQLTELLAKNTHELWAQRRMRDGWSYGPARDDRYKKHPSLVEYEQLPEDEKEYDRQTAMGALKTILAMGYRIERTDS